MRRLARLVLIGLGAALLAVVNGYAQSHGFGELSKRFACNIANGRFLWRNRVGAETVEVRVSHLEQGKAVASWTFSAHDFSLRDFAGNDSKDLAAMAAVIEPGLASPDGYALLDVQAYARMGDAQEVYPSQELILDRGKGKSKTLYVIDKVAGMHSQKVGNALRTIDTWYPAEEGGIGPIAVEPYGSVTSEGRAYRQPKQKADFYNLLVDLELRDAEHLHNVTSALEAESDVAALSRYRNPSAARPPAPAPAEMGETVGLQTSG